MSESMAGRGTAQGFDPATWGTGFRWSVLLSILGPVAWLSFTLLYVGFWAQGFSLFQSVIVILVSLVLLAGLMGAAWTAWGMRRHWERSR
ncbi:MAG TPA: hypothetical protein VFG07_01440 [Thermoplasmata archaeon]|nr:hypothetical protein [Thermoplasmata archaeon]